MVRFFIGVRMGDWGHFKCAYFNLAANNVSGKRVHIGREGANAT